MTRKRLFLYDQSVLYWANFAGRPKYLAARNQQLHDAMHFRLAYDGSGRPVRPVRPDSQALYSWHHLRPTLTRQACPLPLPHTARAPGTATLPT